MHGERGLQSRCRAGQSRGAGHAPVLLAVGQGASCRAPAAALVLGWNLRDDMVRAQERVPREEEVLVGVARSFPA